MKIVENPWLHQIFHHANERITFPTHKRMRNEHIPRMTEKVKIVYIIGTLEGSLTLTATLDLWMSRGYEEVFALVCHYITANCESLAKSIGLVRVEKTNGTALRDVLHQHLGEYGCTN